MAGALEHLGAREVLVAGRTAAACRARNAEPRFIRTELEDWIFSLDYADRTLRDHFQLLSLDGCGLADRPRGGRAPPARSCTTCATRSAPRSITSTGPTYYDRADSMVLDAVTVRNLELIEPIFAAMAERTLLARSRSDRYRHGRPPAAPAPAAPVAGSRRNRSAAGCAWANCCSRPSCAPNCASNSAASSISNGCWRR